MPIGVQNFSILSPEQANPLGYGLSQGIAAHLNQLNAQKLQQLMPFVAPQAQADLQKSQLFNQYYGKDITSQIGLRGAQAGNLGADTRKTNFFLNNPGYFAGDEMKTVQALINMGAIDPNSLKPPTQAAQPQISNPAATTPVATSGTYTPPQGSTAAPDANPLSPMQSPMQSSNNPVSPSQTSAGVFNPSNQSAPFNTNNPMVNAILNKPYASAGYQQRMTQGFNWVHSPVDAKNYQIAQLAGAGIDPSVAVSELSSGLTVPQILQKNGFDPTNPPDPDFLPTRGNIQQLKQRQSALKELDTIGTFIKEGLGPYSQTIQGYSPAQIGDALTGMNPEQQKKFLAARMLAPEYSNIRLMVAQGKTGITAVEQIMDKSMMNVKALHLPVTQDIFEGAQELADKTITDAFSKAQDVYKVGQKTNQSPNVSTQSDDKSVTWKRVNGQLVRS